MIRPAVPDDAQAVVPLIFDAIGDIAYWLTGTAAPEEALTAMTGWFRRGGNRLGYEQIRVAEAEGRVAGMSLAYPGGRGPELDRPLLERFHGQASSAPAAFVKEAEDDEFYLDSLAVASSERGKGLGTALIRDFEAEAARKGFRKASLLVSEDKPRAEALYRSLGYEREGERLILGAVYAHMVKRLDSSDECR